MKPFDYKWTKFYELNSDFPYKELNLDLTKNELIICSTVINSENYSILTTQRLITKENGVENIGNLNGAILKPSGDFKGLNGEAITFGFLILENGTELKYFLETGKASMIMIHGIRTLIRTQQMTKQNIENTMQNWNKQDKN